MREWESVILLPERSHLLHVMSTSVHLSLLFYGKEAPWWLSGKNSLAKQEMQVQSPGWEDPLEEVLAAHFGILSWRIPWTEEPGGLQYIGLQRVGHN